MFPGKDHSCSQEESRSVTANIPSTKHTLYHTSQIIKADIKDFDGINTSPLNINDLTIEKIKEMVPQSLYWLLQWLINPGDSNIESFGDTNSKSRNDADERHILMISQDIIHAATHGRKKMPKHVGLAMVMRHITGSKQVINLLNRMGHCSSYEDAEVIDTSLAEEVLAQKESDGDVIPTNIAPGSFIQVAADNNNLL